MCFYGTNSIIITQIAIYLKILNKTFHARTAFSLSIPTYPQSFSIPGTKFDNKYYASKALRELHDSSIKRNVLFIRSQWYVAGRKARKISRRSSQVVGKKHKEMKKISLIIVIT